MKQNVHVLSDGTVLGTKVIDEATGHILGNITDINISISATKRVCCVATIEVLLPSVDIVCEANVLDLVDKVEQHEFTCKGGQLEDCRSWCTLKSLIRRRIKGGKKE